jgi:hypothetical protein
MRRPAHLVRREIAALDNAQRIQQLGGKLLGPAAIEAQRRERADRFHIAHDLAEIGLEPPKGNEHRSGHAIFLFDPLEGGRMPLEQRSAALQTVPRHHAAGELQEALREHRLAAILGDGHRVVGDAVERIVRRLRRDALRDRLLLEVLQPFREGCRRLAGGGESMRGTEQRHGGEARERRHAEENGGRSKTSHGGSQTSRMGSVKLRSRQARPAHAQTPHNIVLQHARGIEACQRQTR